MNGKHKRIMGNSVRFALDVYVAHEVQSEFKRSAVHAKSEPLNLVSLFKGK